MVGETAVLVAAVIVAALESSASDWEPAALVGVLLALALASDLFAVSYGGQRISGSFLALVLAAALLGPAPATAIGIAAVLFDHLRARNPVPLLIANLATFATFPLVGGLLIACGRRRARGGRVPAARVRDLHGHEPPELPDDRRPPRFADARVAGRRVPQDLRAGPAVGGPQRGAVRARRGVLRAHRRRGDRADAARAADVPVPAARAAALARARRAARGAAARRAGLDDRDARAARSHDRPPLGRGRPLRPRDGRGARLERRRPGPRAHRRRCCTTSASSRSRTRSCWPTRG